MLKTLLSHPMSQLTNRQLTNLQLSNTPTKKLMSSRQAPDSPLQMPASPSLFISPLKQPQPPSLSPPLSFYAADYAIHILYQHIRNEWIQGPNLETVFRLLLQIFRLSSEIV